MLGSGSNRGPDFGALEGSGEPQKVDQVSNVGSSDSGRSQRILNHWELWFPARPGPWRKRTATVGGRKVTGRVQVNELPPTQNDRLHFRVKGPWVKEWREAARDMARARNLPMARRARVSMIVYRPRIGIADPDNDWGRAKPLLDGLRDAGALAKDTYGAVTLGTIEERRGDHGILLVVTEWETASQGGEGVEG
jgi:hypothetical protein